MVKIGRVIRKMKDGKYGNMRGIGKIGVGFL